MLIGLLLQVGLLAAMGLFWLLTKADYIVIAWIVWEFVLNGSLLNGYEVHTAIGVVIVAVPLVAWWGIQRIRICGFYAFKVVACLVCAGSVGALVGHEFCVIWGLVSGAILFFLSLGARMKSSGLYQPKNEAECVAQQCVK